MVDRRWRRKSRRRSYQCVWHMLRVKHTRKKGSEDLKVAEGRRVSVAHGPSRRSYPFMTLVSFKTQSHVRCAHLQGITNPLRRFPPTVSGVSESDSSSCGANSLYIILIGFPA